MRIKICGIASADDAEMAARVGADAIGLNFYENSPRYVNDSTALEILAALPPLVEPVGVLVRPDRQRLLSCRNKLGLGLVQLHGTDAESLRGSAESHPVRFIIAHSVKDAESLHFLERALEAWRSLGQSPSAVLLDAHMAGMFGGTGELAPWQLLVDYDPGIPVILAGGLTGENVAEAIRLVRPYAVDVASGVERAPGIKDEDKLRRFIDQAREAAHGAGL